MAQVAAVLSLFFLLFSIISGGTLMMVNGQQYQKTWCVAKPSTDNATLLGNIDFACSKVDCGVLQKGCTCFSPDIFINHASVAMNLYYQTHGDCDFRGSGLIVITNPSYGNCIYDK